MPAVYILIQICIWSLQISGKFGVTNNYSSDYKGKKLTTKKKSPYLIYCVMIGLGLSLRYTFSFKK